MAMSMTGSGNSICSSRIGCVSSHSVSPVVASFRPTIAQMSPARHSCDLVALVGAHLHQAARRARASSCRCSTPSCPPRAARVDADEGQRAANGVVHDLERQRGERRVVVRLAGDRRSPLGSFAMHRRDVERRRQVVDHRVEQRLHALVPERRAAEHREDLEADAALADRRARSSASVMCSLVLEVLLHQRVVELGAGSIELRRAAFAASRELGGDRRRRRTWLPMLSSSKTSAFIRTRSMTPWWLLLGAQRQLHHQRRWRPAARGSMPPTSRSRRPRGPSC